MAVSKIIILITLGLYVFGVIIELMMRIWNLRGYRQISVDIRNIAAAFGGEISRDGDDIVIKGNCDQSPVTVIFSKAEDKPGLEIRMPVLAKVSIYLTPKREQAKSGKVELRVPNEMFAARFRLRTDNPMETEILVSGPTTLKQIIKLCCSYNTFVTIKDQKFELIERVIPDRDLSAHVIDHVKSMAQIASFAQELPGSSRKTIPLHRRKRRAYHVAVAAAVICIVLGAVVVGAALRTDEVQQVQLPIPEGVPAAHASLIRDVEHWRLAQPEEFDDSARAWLSQQGEHIYGHLEGKFGSETDNGSAYIFVENKPQPSKERRLVLIANNELRFDANFPEIALAARIPKSSIAGIAWKDRAPIGQPNGDGLLIVKHYGEGEFGMVLFTSGVGLVTAIPKDFHEISF